MNPPLPETQTDQALPTDPQPLPGTPFGVLIVGAIGWLFAIIGLIALPWPLPGASPTPPGNHLVRFLVSIPGESTFDAILRHGLNVLPYVIILMVALSLVLATGWRRPQRAVRALTILGILGIMYAMGEALVFGPMIFVVGCVLITVSGWLGWSMPLVSYIPEAPVTIISTTIKLPMAVPSDMEQPLPDNEANEADPLVTIEEQN